MATAHTPEELRALIDQAKLDAHSIDENPITIRLLPGEDGPTIVKARSTRRGEKAETIDPSNIRVLPGVHPIVPVLVAQLIETRANKHRLEEQEAIIKEALVPFFGELEYLAIEGIEKPLLSLKHVDSTRVNTAFVKEEHADDARYWIHSTTRPLRVL